MKQSSRNSQWTLNPINKKGLKVVSTNIRDYIRLEFLYRSPFCVQPWFYFNFHQWHIFSYPLDEQLGWISKEENNAPILRHLRTALPVLRTQPDQAGSHPRFPFVVPWHGWQAYPTCSLVHPQFWRHGGVKMNPSMRRWHVTCSSKILLMFRLVFFRKSGWMLDFLNTSVDIYMYIYIWYILYVYTCIFPGILPSVFWWCLMLDSSYKFCRCRFKPSDLVSRKFLDWKPYQSPKQEHQQSVSLPFHKIVGPSRKNPVGRDVCTWGL